MDTGTRKGGVSDIEELRAHFTPLFARFGAAACRHEFRSRRNSARSPANGPTRPAPMPAAIILYFHGGGFVAGSPETPPRAGRPAGAGRRGRSPFRCATAWRRNAFFPLPVRDGIDAYRGLLASGVDPREVILAGDGSGGGLAFAVALAIRNASLAMPAGIVAMSPWADLSLSGWSLLANQKSDTMLNWELLFQCARHYLRKANPATPMPRRSSPISRISRP